MALEQRNIHMQKQIDLNSYFTSYIIVNEKWSTDLNVRGKFIRLLEKPQRKILVTLGQVKISKSKT
jgi:hypothetical protein